MRQMKRRRDPAPSRLSYRLQRLALTPSVRRMVWIGVPLVALAVSVGGFLADPDRRARIVETVETFKVQIRERPEFMVRLMAIDGATAGVADEIRTLLPLDFPVSSFELDLPQMLGRIIELDAVARADLRIRPGGILQISVDEREPVAIWRNAGTLDLLDITGHRVAHLAARGQRGDLPLIAGWGAERAVEEGVRLIAAAAPLADRLRGLVRVGERRWNVVLDGGQTIMLPEVDPRPALEQVLALDQAQDLFGRDVIEVDMRNAARPTLRLADHAAATLRDIRIYELGAD